MRDEVVRDQPDARQFTGASVQPYASARRLERPLALCPHRGNDSGKHIARARAREPWRRGRSDGGSAIRSEEHTSELQSLMRISYAVFCLKKTKQKNKKH